MDVEKRKMIVNEIDYWRRSKLLPEQYCDFLMNLYQDDSVQSKSFGAASKSILLNSHWKFWILTFATIAFISFIVFNFNSFPIPMQIGSSAFFVIIFYILGFINRNKRRSTAYMFFGIGSLLLLVLGQYMLNLHDVENTFWVLGYLIFCSIIWILLGIVAHMGVFQFCGWAGLILFYGWLLHSRVADIHWLQIQMFWIPLCVLFIWIGWLIHHRKKAIGNVYFLVGLLLWFVPDIYMIVIVENTNQWMQISFVGKLIAAGVILFVLRKKWTEWVA